MNTKKNEKSSWVIAGSTLMGLGVGFIFLKSSALIFVACICLGLGLGLVIAPFIPNKTM